MRPGDIPAALASAQRAGQPLYLSGRPGIGKSALCMQAADTMLANVPADRQARTVAAGGPLWDVRLALLDPVDLRGLPDLDRERGAVRWLPPTFLPLDPAAVGVLLLDELPIAPPLVQGACYQLVLDRRIGEYRLPDGVAIVGAGNRAEDLGAFNALPPALASRFLHVDVETDLDDWTRWALAHGVRTEIVAFARFRPGEALDGYDPDERAFGCPRSIVHASRILDADPSAAIRHEMLAGILGPGLAAELVGFLDVYASLPNPDVVLLNPDTADVPSDPATLYALAGALARKASPTNLQSVITYSLRMPAEFSVMMIRDATARDPALQHHPDMVRWAAEHSAVLT